MNKKKSNALSAIDSFARVYCGDSDKKQGLSGTQSNSGSPSARHVLGSIEIQSMEFSTLPFTGVWKTFLGMPSENFKIMVYGRAGNGKSTFSLLLAGYLSRNLHKRVLYVAGEERFGYTLKEKVQRLGIANENLYLADELPYSFNGYDVIFFDSVNTLDLDASVLETFPKDKAYVWIFQSTKTGQYRGSQAYSHNSDTVVKVEKLKATLDKNRFGPCDKTMKIL